MSSVKLNLLSQTFNFEVETWSLFSATKAFEFPKYIIERHHGAVWVRLKFPKG